ncbi:hypothetical protein J3E68DRAFT_4654 [Trichoderma sp. SZMC 28012]
MRSDTFFFFIPVFFNCLASLSFRYAPVLLYNTRLLMSSTLHILPSRRLYTLNPTNPAGDFPPSPTARSRLR